MGKYQGQNVKTRPLTRDDAKHGSRFNANTEQVVITRDDGTEEVVAKNMIDNAGGAGSTNDGTNQGVAQTENGHQDATAGKPQGGAQAQPRK